jgi:hypothetical protein
MNIDYSDRAQLEAFDDLCINYGRRAGILTQDCPALRLLHDQLGRHGIVNGELSRRISLALEIKLGFLHTHYDLSELAGLDNKYLVHEETRRNYLPLVDIASFSVALRRSRAAFTLVTRIRSLWDKAFLYVALTTEGDATVRQLQQQKSKRKFFFNHFAKGFDGVTPETLERAKNDLSRLEQDFRTPELHGFGNLRSWVFDTPADWDTTHVAAILGHWSVLSDFLHRIFAEYSTSRTSFDAEGGRE